MRETLDDYGRDLRDMSSTISEMRRAQERQEEFFRGMWPNYPHYPPPPPQWVFWFPFTLLIFVVFDFIEDNESFKYGGGSTHCCYFCTVTFISVCFQLLLLWKKKFIKSCDELKTRKGGSGKIQGPGPALGWGNKRLKSESKLCEHIYWKMKWVVRWKPERTPKQDEWKKWKKSN